MDEQPSQVGVTALADAQQRRLASGGKLGRGQAQPRRQIAAPLELLGIADGGYQGGGAEVPNARNGGKAPGDV